MKWRDRLREIEYAHSGELTKLTKGAFVGSVSDPDPVYPNFSAAPERRAIVRFRLVGDAPNAWAVALGAPGDSPADVVADLRARHGERVEIGDVREGGDR